MFSDRHITSCRGWWLGAGALCLGLVFLALNSSIADNASPEAAPQTSAQFNRGKSPNRAAGEYIVTTQPGTSEAQLRELYREYDVREIMDLGGGRFLIKLRNDPGLEALQRQASESGRIKAVQPNFIYRLQ